jgi:Mor family transcriptional regulator
MADDRPRVVLPESMQPVVKAIGISAAISLVHVFAGRKVYIPKLSIDDDRDELERLIGYPLLRQLAAAMGGQALTIPHIERMLRDQRDAEIVRRSIAGESAYKLAADFGLSDRAVRSILSEARTTSKA